MMMSIYYSQIVRVNKMITIQRNLKINLNKIEEQTICKEFNKYMKIFNKSELIKMITAYFYKKYVVEFTIYDKNEFIIYVDYI